jgi:hypothetical protein
MNQPRQRIINKVNDLFEKVDQLNRTIENNFEALDEEDLDKIKTALRGKLEGAIDRIDNPESVFKL